MKIAVITLHHVRNYGSMLQTYATQRALSDLGHDVEIIDFIPKGLTLKTGIDTIAARSNPLVRIVRKISAAVVFAVQQMSMIRFLKKNVSLTRKTYHNYTELKKAPPLADAYLSGSDQIWNTQNANLPEDILAYYLQFAPENAKRIAYASSIGKDAFSEEEKANVSHWLSSFKAIGVRESHGVQLLKDIGVNMATHVVDPTLLLDKEQWMAFCKRKSNPPKKPYIFVYNLNRNPEIKIYAKRLARKENLEIINFASTLDFVSGARNRLYNTAHDFLYYLYHAKYVVTDSFHGTAFSINFSKQFVTFTAPKFNSRIHSILNLFGLQDRLLIKADADADCQKVKEQIDRKTTNDILARERDKSKEFILQSLKEE